MTSEWVQAALVVTLAFMVGSLMGVLTMWYFDRPEDPHPVSLPDPVPWTPAEDDPALDLFDHELELFRHDLLDDHSMNALRRWEG